MPSMLVFGLLLAVCAQALAVPTPLKGNDLLTKRGWQGSVTCLSSKNPKYKNFNLREARCTSMSAYYAGCSSLLGAEDRAQTNDIVFQTACGKDEVCVNIDRPETTYMTGKNEVLVALTVADMVCKPKTEVKGMAHKLSSEPEASFEMDMASDFGDEGYEWQVSCSKVTSDGQLDKSSATTVTLYIDGRKVQQSRDDAWYITHTMTPQKMHLKARCVLRGTEAGIVYGDTNLPTPN